jgi:thiol:disulfide interchange protein DsbC
MTKKIFLPGAAIIIFCLSLSVITCGGESPFPMAGAKSDNQFQTPHNCNSCHKFDEAKFKDLMGAPQLKVVSYEMVDGLWQVLYEAAPGQHNVIYVSPKFDSVFYGQILAKNGRNLTREYMLAHAPQIDTTGIPVRDAIFVMGNREAKNKIFVFDDPECPFCARLHFELKSFLQDHKDHAVYVLLFPLPIHQKSQEKSETVYCLGSLKEKEEAMEGLFKGILENKPFDLPKAKKCDISGLDRIKRYGINTLKLKGTPLIVLPDGRVIDGFVSKKDLEDVISGKIEEKPSTPAAQAERGGV